MCGIAGFLDPTSPETEARERLGRMLARIAHRGPDGEGALWQAPGLALGTRRLSIIDLEGGAQPIWNEDRTIAVVFNGEIYNYVELSRELAAKGHILRTQTDTEVLVHLYEEHGEEMLSRLRGMFAFAIVDGRSHTLLIARDHFGQKPLYYSCDGTRFAFASELKSLLTLPWVKRERDPSAFLDYMVWLSLPNPRTHFRSVWKLGAGALLKLPLQGPGALALEEKCYWRYSLQEASTLRDMDAAVEEVDAQLRDSLRMHLRADVPVGVLLSSGLDSRIVTAYAQELQDGRVQTFTAGFGGEDSELPEAAKTARELGSTHHTLELTSDDFLESLPRVAWHLDEPVGDPAAFAVLRVCELARQQVKVLLSGEGADELFGGYDSRYGGMLSTLARSDRLRRFARWLPHGDPAASHSRLHRLLQRANHSRASEAVALRIEGFPGNVRRPRGLTAVQLRRIRSRMNEIAASHRKQRDTLSELLVLDLEWQLAESLLQKADKMSMAASIELRTPLLDVRVAEAAARIDSSLKLVPGGPGKLVLRHVLARKLNEPLSRPKKGFPVPLGAWLQGVLRAPAEESLFSADASWRNHLDARLVRGAWDDFQRGAWDGARTFHALWLYEVWSGAITGSGPSPT